MNVTFSETRFTALYAHFFNRAYGDNILSGDLVPDWNHDRVIDETDRSQANPANPFRFWINDNADNLDLASSSSGDVAADGSQAPGQSSSAADYGKSSVCGRSDLADYFPVWLNISNVVSLIPPDHSVTVHYKLKQMDSAVNMLYTGLTTNNSGDYLTNDLTCYGASVLNHNAWNSDKQQVPGDDSFTDIPDTFLNNIASQPGYGIILLDGRTKTTKPLVLEVTKNNQTVFTAQLPLSIDSVTNMFRTVNLRNMQNPGVLPEPQNNPDSLNSKGILFFCTDFSRAPTMSAGRRHGSRRCLRDSIGADHRRNSTESVGIRMAVR